MKFSIVFLIILSSLTSFAETTSSVSDSGEFLDNSNRVLCAIFSNSDHGKLTDRGVSLVFPSLGRTGETYTAKYSREYADIEVKISTHLDGKSNSYASITMGDIVSRDPIELDGITRLSASSAKEQDHRVTLNCKTYNQAELEKELAFHRKQNFIRVNAQKVN